MWLAVPLATVATVLVSASAGAVAPVVFGGTGDLRLTSGGSVQLNLLNNTANGVAVSLQAVADDGGEVPSIRLQPRRLQLPPGGSKTVTIVVSQPTKQAAPAEKPADSISGNIVALVHGAGQRGAARRRFTIAASTSSAEPLISKWYVTSYRRFKLGSDTIRNGVLPLRSPTSCTPNPLPATGTLGGISTSAGGAASVSGQCVEHAESVGVAGVRLEFHGLRHQTGDYTGTVDLNGANQLGFRSHAAARTHATCAWRVSTRVGVSR
jgi:hypothetical protein